MDTFRFVVLLTIAAIAGVLNEKAGGSFWTVYLLCMVVVFAADNIIDEVKKLRV